MNVLYIHQYFKTPSEPGGTRSYWVSKELIAKGFNVTVLTSRSEVGSLPVTEQYIDGIKVIYINEQYDQSMGIGKRSRSFINFMIKATRVAFAQKDINIVIATSTPLTIGIPALLLKWFKRVPFIFEVRDLWPEVPIQMGALKNNLLIKLAKWFEKTIYKNAKHIIALSPGMQDGVVKYVPRSKTTLIPNMSKIDEFWPREKDFGLMERLGLDKDSLKVIHFGSLGLANGVHTILESAELLLHVSNIQFVFVGGGSQEKDLQDICVNKGLKNVKFLGNYPMKEISEIVNLCDISLVSFADIPILYTNSPNKLFDSLSAGKPVIVNSNGWTKALVEENNCGFFVNPNFPNELSDLLINLTRDNPLVDEMGKNSRILAETKFDKSILCELFAKTVVKTTNYGV